MKKLNKIITSIPQASSIYWNQLASDRKKKKKVTILSLGEAFFKIKKYNLNKFLRKEENYHYSNSRGLEGLRNKIKILYNKNYGGHLNSIDQILVSAGSKILSYFVFLLILNKGDEVITTEPAWLSYREQIKICGGKITYIKIKSDIEKLEKLVNKKTKIFLLNNPNNPTGRLYTKDEVQYISEVCKKNKIYFVCDEAYSDFLSEQNKFYSACHFDKNLSHTIIVNSLSKNFGMSGWRLGYVIANNMIINKLLILNQHLITCAPTILQTYVSENFDELYKENLKKIKILIKKREKVIKLLRKLNIKFIIGETTFYFFLEIPKKINVNKLCKILLFKRNLSLVPGDAYGKNVKNYLRMSIGTESFLTIKKALVVLKNYLK